MEEVQNAGEVRAFRVPAGTVLKFWTEELRNDALPQLRTYANQNLTGVRITANLTPMQQANREIIYA